MENIIDRKPCLVTAAQGFSVSYNNKLLYSKYSPDKAILQTVMSLNLLPGTLILCLSPVLPYGLFELTQKLPQNCLLLGIEADSELLEFIKVSASESTIKAEWQKINETGKFTMLSKEEILNLPVILNKKQYVTNSGFSLPAGGIFRRVLCIYCSAGTQLHTAFYTELQQSCVNAIMTFWSNTVTLTKFGHNYSKNFFKNLKLLPQTKPIQNYFNSVSKSIIVFGAGQSIDKGIAQLKQNILNGHADDYYILCADTALQPLLKNNIIPDGVFIEEAQQVITKAFIGTAKAIQNKTQVFAGLSSISRLTHNFPLERLSFFTTLYTDADFIHNMQALNLLPPANKPFGSVGLTAVYYALRFRRDDDVPVFIYGLDFSFSAGITHGKGTPAHTNRLLSVNRLNPVQNYGSAFSESVQVATDKKGSKIFTTHILSSYAATFNSLFQNEKNLFDSSETGLPLAIPAANPSVSNIPGKVDIRVKSEYNTNKSEYDMKQCEHNNISATHMSFPNSTQEAAKLTEFFVNESAALNELKDILTGKITLSEEERNNRILELISQREYLYLHFPDGHKVSTEVSFLKRVRAEIEIFLKIFGEKK